MENKVENKSIIQLDIEKWIPPDSEIYFLDLKEFLFREMILKELEFREMIEAKDWAKYSNKPTVLFVSNNAIIPQWAYLIIANKLQVVNSPCFIKSDNYREQILIHHIEQTDFIELRGKRVFVKGCSKERLSQQPYILLSQKLTPIVKALAFGESCSSVPLFKN